MKVANKAFDDSLAKMLKAQPLPLDTIPKKREPKVKARSKKRVR